MHAFGLGSTRDRGRRGPALQRRGGHLCNANPAAPLADFPLANVTINWGDGTTSNATSITQPGGIGTALNVFGTHTYAEEGATLHRCR